MYCSHCATPIAPGLSFCNRCGASLKERDTSKTGAISAFLTAITLLGAIGLVIMLGGALVLRKAAGLSQDLVAVFMLFTFIITILTEVKLIKQLSRLTGPAETKRSHQLPGQDPLPSPQIPHYELHAAPGEPVPSVTENTTRTLEYSRREQN